MLTPFFDFCKLVWHDIHDCCTLEMMHKRTFKSLIVQGLGGVEATENGLNHSRYAQGGWYN